MQMITWNKRRTALAGEAAEAAQTKPSEDSVDLPVTLDPSPSL